MSNIKEICESTLHSENKTVQKNSKAVPIRKWKKNS